MVIRMSVLAGLLVAVVAASVSAQAKVYKTPQEVFDASKEAAKKGDMKAYFVLLEPESMKQVAAGLAVLGAVTRADVESDKTGKVKAQIKPFLDALDKHGLTAAKTKDFKAPKEKDPEKVVKAAKPLLELIKDKPAFAAEVLGAIQKVRKEDDSGFKVLAKAKLTDVKIDGDKATGTVVNTVKDKENKDKEKKDPISFTKVGKGWLIKVDPPAKPKEKGKDG
jgi:hypothetical protein